MELAAQHADQALDLGRRCAEAPGQRAARGVGELAVRLAEPAQHGRAMHAVERAELARQETIEMMLAQERAMPRRECAEGLAQRALELGVVQRAQVGDFGVDGR